MKVLWLEQLPVTDRHVSCCSWCTMQVFAPPGPTDLHLHHRDFSFSFSFFFFFLSFFCIDASAAFQRVAATFGEAPWRRHLRAGHRGCVARACAVRGVHARGVCVCVCVCARGVLVAPSLPALKCSFFSRVNVAAPARTR